MWARATQVWDWAQKTEICWIFILHYAKLRMLDMYYNFFEKYFNVRKYEELKMDTDSLHSALAEQDLYDCNRAEMKEQWEALQSEDCTDFFFADATRNFFPRTWCAKYKMHDKREPGLSEEEIKGTEMLCSCSKTHCCYDVSSNKFIFSSRGLNKRMWNRALMAPGEI